VVLGSSDTVIAEGKEKPQVELMELSGVFKKNKQTNNPILYKVDKEEYMWLSCDSNTVYIGHNSMKVTAKMSKEKSWCCEAIPICETLTQ
jgi:hypothetical protein